MSECLRKKTTEDFLRDLVNPELEHDHEKEINEILGFIDMEMARIAEECYHSTRKAQLKAERLQAILECVADSIMLKGRK